jgi:hypothetical protein
MLGYDFEGIVAIVDSDMFLVEPLHIGTELLGDGTQIVGLPQIRGRITYLWNGLVFMDMPELKDKRNMNWDCGQIDGHQVDTGGMLWYWLVAHPEVSMGIFGNIQLKSLNVSPDNSEAQNQLVEQQKNDPYSMEFHVARKFLHYRAGGNWNKQPLTYIDNKNKQLCAYLRAIGVGTSE